MIPKKILILMGLILVAALVAMGCSGDVVPVPGEPPPPGVQPPPEALVTPFKVTGGGWINAAACEDETCKLKATFGFNLHYTPNETGPPTIKGQFQYTDHGGWVSFREVSFHGVVAEVPPFSAGGTVYEGSYEGLYTPQPKKLGEGGRFVVTIMDNGQFGPSTSDNMAIQLIGGVFNGYSNSGNLKGGHIQFHQDEAE